ncbi:SMC-Scp complex subunit ScpB [Rothia kristinae]|uniref:SMC-Scp complex subunit ScpB n=1 Tax=Rothia kristinae TaxID=37923 RepID=UPI0034294811
MNEEQTGREEESAVRLRPGGVRAAVEAILIVAAAPVDELELAEALQVPAAEVAAALEQLARDYDGHPVPDDGGTLEHSTAENSTTDPDAVGLGTAASDAAEREAGDRDGADSARYAEESAVQARAPETAGSRVREPRGVELRRVAGGWRLYSRTDFAPWVRRFVQEGQTAKLSQAALETLAVIAYRQPISRARVSSIRGVNVDGVVRTLRTRGLVVEAQEPGESGATLFETTPLFLEKIGLESLADLPPIAPHLPGAEDVAEYEDRASAPRRLAPAPPGQEDHR